MVKHKLPLRGNFILGHIVTITLLLVLAFVMAAMDLKDGMPLQVSTQAFRQSAYKSFDLPNHSTFDTGTRGQLWWYPQGFGQALILSTVEGGGIDVYHVTLLYILVVIFYFMLKGSEKEIVFSKKVSRGFSCIIFIIAVSGSLESLKSILVSLYFSHITGGKFHLSIPYFPSMFYYAIGTMLFFIVKFPQKAIELQQEAELTI